MATAAGPSCGPSAQGVKPPSVLRPGCCCCMQEMTPGPHFLSRGAQTFWHRARAYSFSLWHCLGHSQGSLQCHFSRCKAGSFKELRVRIVLVDAFTDLMRCRK